MEAVNYYRKVPHLRFSSSPRSASEKSYSKCNIPCQLINNCSDLLHFISLVWLFLNLGPTITWNWKLKQWNIRRLLIILTLEPVAYNLRHFLRFIFSFSILSLLTWLFLSHGFVISHGTAWYLMWPGYLRREGFNKENYRTICVADQFTGFYMLRIFTERFFRI